MTPEQFHARRTEGMFGMMCFNSLSAEQQDYTIRLGYLPFPWIPLGDECGSPAEVEVTTMFDKYPGPRFYCRPCAIDYLAGLS